MSLRLRFWLRATDIANALEMRARRFHFWTMGDGNAPKPVEDAARHLRRVAFRLYYWTVSKASDATTWDDVRARIEENDDAPF